MDFTQVLREEIMDLQMEAKDKDEALRKLVDLLEKAGAIESCEGFLKDVMERESEGPTGIGNYIAIPHGKSKYVKQTSVALAKLKEPISWETLDGKPVKIIFLFAVPNNDETNHNHLKLLSQLAGILSYDEAQEKLLSVQDKGQVINIFESRK